MKGIKISKRVKRTSHPEKGSWISLMTFVVCGTPVVNSRILMMALSMRDSTCSLAHRDIHTWLQQNLLRFLVEADIGYQTVNIQVVNSLGFSSHFLCPVSQVPAPLFLSSFTKYLPESFGLSSRFRVPPKTRLGTNGFSTVQLKTMKTK